VPSGASSASSQGKSIWVFGGYGLAPISIIDTDEGLTAFHTGDTKHDGEFLSGAVRTFSDKPIKAIIYGQSHNVFGAGVLAEGQEDIQVIGHPNLNAVVEANLKAAGAPACTCAGRWWSSSRTPPPTRETRTPYSNSRPRPRPSSTWAQALLRAGRRQGDRRDPG